MSEVYRASYVPLRSDTVMLRRTHLLILCAILASWFAGLVTALVVASVENARLRAAHEAAVIYLTPPATEAEAAALAELRR